MEIILIALALSLDAFVTGIAYGTGKIKIPFLSLAVINTVCVFVLGIAMVFGVTIKRVLPQGVAPILGFVILVLLGAYYLLESVIKSYLKNKGNHNRKVRIKVFDIYLIADIYIDGTKADKNQSKTLDSKEAFYLALVLSLDSLAVGFGSSLGNIRLLPVIALSLATGFVSIGGGLLLGRKIVEKSKVNLSWLSGLILIILGICKLL